MAGLPPLVVSSVRDHPWDAAMRWLGGLPVDIIPLDEAQVEPGRRVVLMRCGFETELSSPALVKAQFLEAGYSAAGARVLNRVSRTWRLHRKDVWYPLLADDPVLPAPRMYLHNATLEELLVAMRSGELPVPFVYRFADYSGGVGTFLVTDESDLAAAHAALARKPPRANLRRIAVEYVDGRQGDRFVRFRIVVLDKTIDLQHRTLGAHWVSNRNSISTGDLVVLETALPEAVADAVVALGDRFGLDLYAVDLVPGPGGTYYVVDINPGYFFLESRNTEDPFHGHFSRLARLLHDLNHPA